MTASAVRILFVCLGNICRSPTAEAVMRQRIRHTRLPIDVDSAGTIGAHSGSSPDRRSMAAGEARGYSFRGQRSRKVSVKDFDNFDYIVAMDKSNLADLKAICPREHHSRLSLMLSHGASALEQVPDPYYGGEGGFEQVLDLVEDACDGLLEHIRQRHF